MPYFPIKISDEERQTLIDWANEIAVP
jgi:hypothetical protein